MKLAQKIAVGVIRIRFRLLSLFSKKKTAAQAFRLFCTPQTRNVKKLPAVFEAAEKLQFVFSGYTIAGYRWNKGGHRRALILHGFESSAINFDFYIQPLIEKGYEVLAFDAPAHGRSSGRQINAVIYRDLVRHIYTGYGPIQSFMAHSFGGLAVCLALAEIRLENDCRIALIAPATESTTAFEQFFQFVHITDPVVKTECNRIVTKLSGHPISWFSIPRTLEQIAAKILWVHDRADTVTPFSDVKPVIAQNYPAIEFVLTEGLGHRKIYRDADVSAKIIGFL